jgi:hypothetical protein
VVIKRGMAPAVGVVPLMWDNRAVKRSERQNARAAKRAMWTAEIALVRAFLREELGPRLAAWRERLSELADRLDEHNRARLDEAMRNLRAQRAARRVLDELAVWLRCVYLRYPDGAQALPECWSWHPDVVEELLWLMHAWLAAYQGEKASVALVGDWHDRYRPNVAARIRAAVRVCSLEVHLEPERGAVIPPPSIGSVPAVAHWWTCVREQRPPVPTQADLDAAEVRLRTRR